MPQISITDIADIAESTLPNNDRKKITDLATVEQRHYFLPEFMDEKRQMVEGGSSVEFDVLTQDNEGARHIGQYELKQIHVRDGLKKGRIEWAQTVNNIAMTGQEIRMNMSDPLRLQNLGDVRFAMAWLAFSNLIERTGWSKPVDSTDTITPLGIMAYIVKKVDGDSLTDGSGEFGGGNPTGYSGGIAGIDSDVIGGWKNWTHAYVDVTDDDLNKKLKLASYKTNFFSPIVPKIIAENKVTLGQPALYMKYETLDGLETLAESKNENLGKDIAPYNGEVSFQRKPMRAVPYLDNDSDNPIYGINWSFLYMVMMETNQLHRSKMAPLDAYEDTVASQIMMGWNLKCTNRRAQWVLSTAADNTRL